MLERVGSCWKGLEGVAKVSKGWKWLERVGTALEKCWKGVGKRVWKGLEGCWKKSWKRVGLGLEKGWNVVGKDWTGVGGGLEVVGGG